MIRFTRHARNRMRRDGVPAALIGEVLANPDIVSPTMEARQNAWRRSEGRWIRVTFVREADDIVVITVTVRRRGPVDG